MHKAIRYIGSKQKLLNFLEDNMLSKLKDNESFFEGFSGSGILSQYIASKDIKLKVTGADISKYSESLFLIPNIYNEFSKEELFNIFKNFSLEKPLKGIFYHEFSPEGKPVTYHEPRNFYHPASAIMIDTYKHYISNLLNQNMINIEQKNILMFFLLSYACKSANTTSVFGAFLKGKPKFKPLDLSFFQKVINDLEEVKKTKSSFSFIENDIINSLEKIGKQDIIYLDPPYNTRKYESNYHILNYVADLDFNIEKIKKGTKTALPIQQHKNPFGNAKNTETIFKQMILLSVKKSKKTYISYNTDGIITQEWMEKFCRDNNLKLQTETLTYKRFKAKKSDNNEKELKEILWNIKK